MKHLVAVGVVLSLCVFALPPRVHAADLTAADLERWLQAYQAAWESRDAEQAAGLFTANASYRVNPFETAHQGRDQIRRYWAEVTRDQQDVRFSYEVLAVSGNTGIAQWHAEFSARSTGAAIALDGIFVLDFASADKCQRLREWWHLKVDEAPDG
ncbi:MAG: nuclear transport factor 2 family protein [Gammaproteobacteria bacterium]|nr:nuclear transport factor 2 family protein [Gammaproteobacteria bacterium]NNM01504.1 nuclear transport factor 2 family protein [Gammaproteobacteria bacterium]